MLKLSHLAICVILFIVWGCHDEGIDPDNYAKAKKDGQDWKAQVVVKYSDRFGDSSLNIILYTPNEINPRESLGFFHVPLKENLYHVKDGITIWDTLDILGAFNPIKNEFPYVIYHPDDHIDNKFIIESFDMVTNEMIISFEGTFVTPSPLPFNQVVFTEGEIRTKIK